MKRQVFATDPRTGVARHSYIDCGPMSATLGHGRRLVNGGMQSRQPRTGPGPIEQRKEAA